MQRICSIGGFVMTSLGISLLLLSFLAVPRNAFADPDQGCLSTCQYNCFAVGGPCLSDPTSQACYECLSNCYASCGWQEYATCSDPISNSCPVNNGYEMSCPGIGCVTATKLCWCKYNSGSGTCYCP